MVEGAFIDFVKQGHLNTTLVRNMNNLSIFSRFISALTGQVVIDMLFYKPIAEVLKMQVNRMVKGIRFEEES